MSELENDIGDMNAVKNIDKRYVLLIRKGEYILNCIRVGNLQVDLHTWIIEAADHIIPIMPLDIPEYKEVNEIRKLYCESKILIPGKILYHVSKIFENLLIAYKCFNLGVIGSPKDIPPEILADIAYNLIKQTRDYVKDNLVKQLIGKEDGKTKRTALLHSYGRIYCWVESIIKLNSIFDYLSIAGCTRAILEIFIDMHFLCNSNEHSHLDVERYFSFPDVSRFKTAKYIISLRNEYNLVDPDEQRPVEKFLSDAPDKEETLKSVREKLWGRTRSGKLIQPQHWTNLSLVDRVKKINNERIMNTYLETYYYCNWSVHSGYSDFPGKKAEDVHLFNWHLYSLSNKMFVESSILINNDVSVIDNHTLQNDFDNIERVSSRRFWGELVKAGIKANKSFGGN